MAKLIVQQVSVLVVLVFSTSLFGAPPKSLEVRVADLESEVLSLKKLVAVSEAHGKAIDTLATVTDNHTKEIGNLDARIAALTGSTSDLTKRIEDIAEPSAAGGRYKLKLLGNMSEPAFRQEFGQAVQQSMPTHGTVTIRNRMLTMQEIRVNSMVLGVAPGETRVVSIPVGNFTTEIPYYEGQKIWFLGAPKFQQNIELVPRPYYR